MSETTNATYLLNTNASNGTAAHAWCGTNGGHLVAYASLEEQAEVEQVRTGSHWASRHCRRAGCSAHRSDGFSLVPN